MIDVMVINGHAQLHRVARGSVRRSGEGWAGARAELPKKNDSRGGARWVRDGGRRRRWSSVGRCVIALPAFTGGQLDTQGR